MRYIWIFGIFVAIIVFAFVLAFGFRSCHAEVMKRNVDGGATRFSTKRVAVHYPFNIYVVRDNHTEQEWLLVADSCGDSCVLQPIKEIPVEHEPGR